MDTNEARGILLAESAKYRAKNYGDLVALLRHQDTYEIIGPSETVYQLELQAFWDDKATGVLRVRTANEAPHSKLWGITELNFEDFSEAEANPVASYGESSS
jgi:hypothetical protein